MNSVFGIKNIKFITGDGGLKIGAHPLGHKREAGPIKQPDPKCRPKKEKPSSPAPGAYDVNN